MHSAFKAKWHSCDQAAMLTQLWRSYQLAAIALALGTGGMVFNLSFLFPTCSSAELRLRPLSRQLAIAVTIALFFFQSGYCKILRTSFTLAIVMICQCAGAMPPDSLKSSVLLHCRKSSRPSSSAETGHMTSWGPVPCCTKVWT